MDDPKKHNLPMDPMWYIRQPDDSDELKREKHRRFQELTIEQRFEWNDYVCARQLEENPNLLNERYDEDWWPGARVQILELPDRVTSLVYQPGGDGKQNLDQ